ncbi:MAG: AMP-binding protein [Candidatus Competibacteraceae bacterium]
MISTWRPFSYQQHRQAQKQAGPVALRNMPSGACSVADYLGNHAADRILAILPFSFDYGLSQLTTAFVTGACAVLMDYLLPRDVIHTIVRERITGLAAVPPMRCNWPNWRAGAAVG